MSQPRCHHCGEVIGVYEPMILSSAGHTRETSLAAQPDLGALVGGYHLACHAATRDRAAGPGEQTAA